MGKTLQNANWESLIYILFFMVTLIITLLIIFILFFCLFFNHFGQLLLFKVLYK